MLTIYNLRMVKFDPQKHHRRSIRLQGYDYSQAGAYFVTIVAWRRDCLFGEVANREMRLNKVGKIVEWEWLELPKRLSYVELGVHMVMPNHFHGILFIHENVGATQPDQSILRPGSELLQFTPIDGTGGSPLRPHGPKPMSLGAIIAQFKSRATKRIWKIPVFKETPIWQRNYYEHVIRNEKDLQNKTDYIKANPLLWNDDNENPINIKEIPCQTTSAPPAASNMRKAKLHLSIAPSVKMNGNTSDTMANAGPRLLNYKKIITTALKKSNQI